MSKERPILFSTPMVIAILDGKKTATRRIIKPQPEQKVMGGGPMKALTTLTGEDNPVGWTWKGTRFMPWPKFLEDHCCPYGKTGDIIWVRETFENYQGGWNYKAGKYGLLGEKWKPSIFMPKEAARIWLEVVSVKVQRVQSITEDDAKSEGVFHMIDKDGNYNVYWDYIKKSPLKGLLTAKESFKSLWISINEKESWEADDWCWVVEFKVLSTTGKP